MEQKRIIAAIEQVGGKVTVDERGPISVDLIATPAGDGTLAEPPTWTRLQELKWNPTRVTDPGLADLRGLLRLRSLFLGGTDISDTAPLQVEVKKGKNAVDPDLKS